MTGVLETRESGIEIVDIDPDFGEEVPEEDEPEETVVFRTPSVETIQVAETAGHAVTVDAQHFIAAAIDREADEMTQALTGEEREQRAMVHVSNEDGVVGGAFVQVDSGEAEDAIDAFEDDYL